MFLIIELLFIVILSMILFIVYRHEKSLLRSVVPQAIIEEYWDGKERREHFRFKKELEVNYIVEKKTHLKRTGKSADISEGGMKLVLDEKLAKGTILDLKIALPKSKHMVEVEGQVMWLEEISGHDSSGKRLFQTGIQFLAIKEPSDDSLLGYIRDLAAKPDKT